MRAARLAPRQWPSVMNTMRTGQALMSTSAPARSSNALGQLGDEETAQRLVDAKAEMVRLGYHAASLWTQVSRAPRPQISVRPGRLTLTLRPGHLLGRPRSGELTCLFLLGQAHSTEESVTAYVRVVSHSSSTSTTSTLSGSSSRPGCASPKRLLWTCLQSAKPICSVARA